MAFEYIIDYLLENRLLVSTLGKLYMHIITSLYMEANEHLFLFASIILFNKLRTGKLS